MKDGMTCLIHLSPLLTASLYTKHATFFHTLKLSASSGPHRTGTEDAQSLVSRPMSPHLNDEVFPSRTHQTKGRNKNFYLEELISCSRLLQIPEKTEPLNSYHSTIKASSPCAAPSSLFDGIQQGLLQPWSPQDSFSSLP